MHFHKTLTRVAVGEIDASATMNVTLWDEDVPISLVRRLQVWTAWPYGRPAFFVGLVLCGQWSVCACLVSVQVYSLAITATALASCFQWEQSFVVEPI